MIGMDTNVLMRYFAQDNAEHLKQWKSGRDMTVRYRHYKGGIYELVCEATMEADLTPLIVYRASDGSIWCRPKAVFFELIEVDGVQVQRFEQMH
jgi:hypothetical protein